MENSTTWRNLFINVINGTLTPPGNLTTALSAINATVLESVLGSVQIPSDDGTNETVVTALQNATGITVFVPADDAFTSDVNSTLQGLQGNTTALRAIIQNHVCLHLPTCCNFLTYRTVHQRDNFVLPSSP